MNLVCTYFVIFLLVASALGKLGAIKRFRPFLPMVGSVSPMQGLVLGVALCGSELVLAICLNIGTILVPTCGLVGALFILFGLYQIWGLSRPGGLTCSCFGGDERPITWFDAFRSLSVIFACGGILASRMTRGSVSHQNVPELPAMGVSLLVLVLILHLSEIRTIFSASQVIE